MNTNIIFVRVFGQLIPVDNVTLVQKDPNSGKIVQEIPLSRPLEDLMEYNLTSFVKIHNNRHEWAAALESKDGS